MAIWIEENWQTFFILMWLFGAWALSLPFSRSGRARKIPRLGAFGSIRGQAYSQVGYSLSAYNRLMQNDPSGKSAYLRAQFFLLYSAGFKPHNILSDWFTSLKWQKQRRLFRAERRRSIDMTIAALKEGRIHDIYQPHEAPISRPSALNYPLLPSQFTLFVGKRFSYTNGRSRGHVETGFYICHVLDWQDENSYAETIRLDGLEGAVHDIQQLDLLDALRTRKAAVESVSFLGLPIFVYTSRKRKLPRLRPEQYISGQLPIRSPSARDFAQMDSRLLELFGGINTINLLRLSWFYHPSYGVKPDEAKFQRLVARSNSLNKP